MKQVTAGKQLSGWAFTLIIASVVLTMFVCVAMFLIVWFLGIPLWFGT